MQPKQTVQPFLFSQSTTSWSPRTVSAAVAACGLRGRQQPRWEGTWGKRKLGNRASYYKAISIYRQSLETLFKRITNDKRLFWQGNPKTCPWSLQLEAGGRAVGTAAGSSRGGVRRPRVCQQFWIFFCCRSTRRRKPNKTHSHLLSTNFWDRFTKVTGKFPSAGQAVCVICCRHVHIASCQKVSTRCLYCLYCLSLGKCKKRAMHLL